MDSNQAKEILATYRQGIDDARDPVFAEALAQAECDPELAQWLAHQQTFDSAFKGKLREIAVPADLAETILAGQKIVRPRIFSWRFAGIGLTTAVAALIIISLTLWFTLRPPQDFNAYRNQMTKLVSGEYKMMLETNDQHAVRQFLVQHHGHADYASTPAMDQLRLEGCTLVDWHRQHISLVCLDRGGDNDLFLFIADRSAFPDAPQTASPQLAAVGPMATATWTIGDKTYLLTTRGNPDQLRRYL